MKRFLVFSGMDDRPLGGWRDFWRDFDTYDEAVDSFLELHQHGADWWHVVDSHHGWIIAPAKVGDETAHYRAQA